MDGAPPSSSHDSLLLFLWRRRLPHHPIWEEAKIKGGEESQRREWKRKKDYGTRSSQVVSNPSTNRARRGLTSLIGREVVLSSWCGRNRNFFLHLFITSTESLLHFDFLPFCLPIQIDHHHCRPKPQECSWFDNKKTLWIMAEATTLLVLKDYLKDVEEREKSRNRGLIECFFSFSFFLVFPHLLHNEHLTVCKSFFSVYTHHMHMHSLLWNKWETEKTDESQCEWNMWESKRNIVELWCRQPHSQHNRFWWTAILFVFRGSMENY